MTYFVIVGVSVAAYPTFSSPQTILGLRGVVDGNGDILHPFLLPRLWVDAVLDSQGPPVDRGGLSVLQGPEVVLGQTAVDALLQFEGIPQFGGEFVKRHDFVCLQHESENKNMVNVTNGQVIPGTYMSRF